MRGTSCKGAQSPLWARMGITYTMVAALFAALLACAFFVAPHTAWADTVVDDSTADLSTSSSAIGQVLTDKTVSLSDTSDLLVTLSALSSSSSTVTTQPLDIVLVLDVSGSMDERLSGGTTKLQALQAAVNSFIDATAQANASLSGDQRHRVALVKFAGRSSDSVGNGTYEGGSGLFPRTYNYSQRVSELQDCTDATKGSLKSTVSNLQAGGATQADYGLHYAQTELNANARADAKKVVIFFTDGEPTSGSNFEDSVANAAVQNAKGMKDTGATIYTIGVFSGANPSDTQGRTNSYMNAVSSNYPNATAYDRLGTREDGTSAYYKAASDADQLSSIFDEIATEINRSSPLRENSNLTFTDQLGEHMALDTGNVNVVVGGTTYPVALDASGKGSAGGVSVSYDAATRTVTATVPASLVPVAQYDADGQPETADPEPVRIEFGVNAPTDDELANPDDALSAYIANHTEDGKVAFYSNAYSGGADGDATATFTPAAGNAFYENGAGNAVAKGSNPTGTATNVSNPSAAGGTVTVALGNNGKITKDLPTVTLTVTKIITGNLGDANRDFGFTLTADEATLGKLASDDPVTVAGDTATFTLKHQGSVTMTLPAGAKVSLAEDAADGYQTTYQVNDGAAVPTLDELTLSDKTTSITVTNKKDGIVDVGVDLDSSGPIAIGVVALAGGVALALRSVMKRRSLAGKN